MSRLPRFQSTAATALWNGSLDLDGEGFHSDEEGTGEFLDRFGQYAELKF
jgi:hypothetical protein